MKLLSKFTDLVFKFIDYLAVKFDLPTSYDDPRSPVDQALKPNIETAKRLTSRAEEVFSEGNSEKAINILMYVISKFPDYYPAFNNLATILFIQGDLQRSLSLFARAYRLCKTDNELIVNYAEALRLSGKRKEAEELLKKLNSQ